MYIFDGVICYYDTMESLSPQQQLQQLEKEYQQRRTALEEQASEKQDSVVSGHEAMSHVVENQIQQQMPNFQASTHAPRTVSDDTLPPEAMEKIQNWINVSFSQGVWQAIKEAKQSGDMALIDAFHGALTGQLYDSLIERKKLDQVTWAYS